MGMMIDPSDVAFCVDENNWGIYMGDGTSTSLRTLTLYELADGYYSGGSHAETFGLRSGTASRERRWPYASRPSTRSFGVTC